MGHRLPEVDDRPPMPGNTSVAVALGYVLRDGKWCAPPVLGDDYIELWDEGEIPRA